MNNSKYSSFWSYKVKPRPKAEVYNEILNDQSDQKRAQSSILKTFAMKETGGKGKRFGSVLTRKSTPKQTMARAGEK